MIYALTPLLLSVAYGLLMWQFSAWHSQKRLRAQSEPLRDTDLAEVCARFAAALEVARIDVRVLRIEQVNGLAASDGQIFLTQGFLREKAAGRVSVEELASVIAHELGHVAHGHMRRRMIDFTGQSAGTMVLAGVLSRVVPVIGAQIAALLSRLVAAKLSRRNEFEADAWASALMIKAGYGTAPQKSLFRKLDQLTGASASQSPAAWLHSHPKSHERIAEIEANEQRWRA